MGGSTLDEPRIRPHSRSLSPLICRRRHRSGSSLATDVTKEIRAAPAHQSQRAIALDLHNHALCFGPALHRLQQPPGAVCSQFPPSAPSKRESGTESAPDSLPLVSGSLAVPRVAGPLWKPQGQSAAAFGCRHRPGRAGRGGGAGGRGKAGAAGTGGAGKGGTEEKKEEEREEEEEEEQHEQQHAVPPPARSGRRSPRSGRIATPGTRRISLGPQEEEEARRKMSQEPQADMELSVEPR
ncbi:coiled-coil domain-containing protein 9-like [Prinia subflava]|uniref:coiled-coil domain-containing protein 9-like n=1 Tax=Prinia subflava TaxID=208062 RepID=UPI002FE18145